MYHSVNFQRYGKAKGMKVKHLVQLVTLTVLFTWFLYQLNSSHKAKVLSLRTEKEDEVDDELLITSDSAGSGLGAGDGVDRDEDAEVADEGFIDTKSVVKSRKELRPLDEPELEQTIAEGDRVDDVFFDDSGEGDGDGIVNSEESVRRAEAMEIDTQGEKGAVVDHESIEPVEKVHEGEDEGADSVVKEFDGPEERVLSNTTDEVEADSREELPEEEVEKKTETTPSEAFADDIPDKTQPDGSESSEQIITLKTDIPEENLTEKDEVGTEDLQVTNETKTDSAAQYFSEEMEADKNLQGHKTITSPSLSAEPLAENEANYSNLERVEGPDKESDVSRRLFPRSHGEASKEAVAGPIASQEALTSPIPSSQNGADSETEDSLWKLPSGSKTGQRSGVGDNLRIESFVDDKSVTAAEEEQGTLN